MDFLWNKWTSKYTQTVTVMMGAATPPVKKATLGAAIYKTNMYVCLMIGKPVSLQNIFQG